MLGVGGEPDEWFDEEWTDVCAVDMVCVVAAKDRRGLGKERITNEKRGRKGVAKS